jgi:hypothetical protein
VYSLAQNFPNPFNPETNITFALPEASAVVLQVYNVLGQRIATLLNGDLQAGNYRISWQSREATGMYLLRLEAASLGPSTRTFVSVKKMMVIK